MKTGLSPESLSALMSAYDAGLLAGFDDIPLTFTQEATSLVTSSARNAIGGIAQRHGAVIRKWWASYAILVTALFSGTQS